MCVRVPDPCLPYLCLPNLFMSVNLSAFLDHHFWIITSGPLLLDNRFWTITPGPLLLDHHFWTITGPAHSCVQAASNSTPLPWAHWGQVGKLGSALAHHHHRVNPLQLRHAAALCTCPP